jgi:lipopolysaccharide transport system permease protein
MYSGTALGTAWIALGPLLLLSLYATIYAVIFKIRVPNFTIQEYVLNVFSGLVPFLAFAQGLSAGAGALQSGQSLLSNANFMAEMIPGKAVVVAYVMLPVGLIITFAGDLTFSKVTATWLLVPVVAALQLMFSIGIAFFVSLISLVFRDIQIMIQYIIIALLVITPIAYTPDMVPSQLNALMYANPLFYFVSSYQHLIILNVLPPLPVIVIGCAVSVSTFALGLWFFHRARPHLSDLI